MNHPVICRSVFVFVDCTICAMERSWGMKVVITALLCVVGVSATPTTSLPASLPVFDHKVDLPTTRPLVLAHRGSSGQIPEHTVMAYQLAVDERADVIECDVCVTRDLRLVCRHESWLSKTTDVADKFPERQNTYHIPEVGEDVTDYFTVDFTLAELKTLRVKQNLEFRDQSYDGQLQIASFEEYIEVAQNAPRPVGIYPETKNPDFVNNLDFIRSSNTSIEKLVVDVLTAYGYTEATHPCFLQSFSKQSVRTMSQLTSLPLIMLFDRKPEEVTNDDLADLASFCYGIGPWKNMIIEVNQSSSHIIAFSDLVERAHRYGLRVHAYTFRNEDHYLAFEYGQDPYVEYDRFLPYNVDGYFTDFPATLYRYMESKYRLEECTSGVGTTSRQVFMLTLAILLSVDWADL